MNTTGSLGPIRWFPQISLSTSSCCLLIASLMNSCLSCRSLTDRRNKAVREGATGSCCMGNHKCHLNYLTVGLVATHSADMPSLTSDAAFREFTAATQVLPARTSARLCVTVNVLCCCWWRLAIVPIDVYQRSVWCHEMLWPLWARWFSHANKKIQAGKVKKKVFLQQKVKTRLVWTLAL